MNVDIELEGNPPDWFVPGWDHRPDEVEAIRSIQPIGDFADTDAGQNDAPIPDYINLDDAAIKVTGKILPTRNQGNAGTCVSFGTTRAVEYTLLAAIAAGANCEFPELGIATEPTYGGSRVEVGKGRLGRGDGSIGAWAAQFVKDWGICPRQKYPDFNIDLSQYSIAISRNWGINGVPDKFEPTLRQHPIRAIAMAKTLADIDRALAQGHGIAESSSYLLRSTRDSNGIAAMYRGGGHCQGITGRIVIDGVAYYYISNSWGDGAMSGGTHPKFPSKSGALVHKDYITAILAQGDTWIFSNAVGFPAKDFLNWLI